MFSTLKSMSVLVPVTSQIEADYAIFLPVFSRMMIVELMDIDTTKVSGMPFSFEICSLNITRGMDVVVYSRESCFIVQYNERSEAGGGILS